MALLYLDYIKVREILDLQKPWSTPPEHDEMLFIVVHQTFELWFKQLLFEFNKIKQDFEAGKTFALIHTFKRARTIMKTLVGQMDILETMTPLSFASFRERLDTASGFQSLQFREIEFVLGYKRSQLMNLFEQDAACYTALKRRYDEPTIVDSFYRFLHQNEGHIPKEVLERDVRQMIEPNETVQNTILEIYKAKPEMSILMELMVDLDEGFQEWRYRHVKLTERTIGNKIGTGGSSGTEFLKKSLFKPVFPDLWAVRHRF